MVRAVDYLEHDSVDMETPAFQRSWHDLGACPITQQALRHSGRPREQDRGRGLGILANMRYIYIYTHMYIHMYIHMYGAPPPWIHRFRFSATRRPARHANF